VTATLRVLLDQLASPTDPMLADASRELTSALIATSPRGCEVEGIVPALPAAERDAAVSALAGLADVRWAPLARRELATAFQLGVASGLGGGMVHSPTLFAPLVRHDRVHDHDQTVVTVWDLQPWESPDELPRNAVAWHRAMLKRAAKHADAIVVPTHSMADRLSALARVEDRIRVIPGAASASFAVPTDEVGRRRELGVPEGFVMLSGGLAASDALAVGFGAVAAAGLDTPVVVIDAPEGEEPAIVELASASGIPERQVHVRGALSVADRGALFGGAVALVAPSRRTVFPWRIVEALALGVPVIAADSAVHNEILLDGGVLAGGRSDVDTGEDAEALGEGLRRSLASAAAVQKASVLSADRGRAFSWRGAAERVWQLHADL